MNIYANADDLLFFMQDEGLGEVMLRNWKPRPGSSPPPDGRIGFEWGLQVSERRLQIYEVCAEGVTHWALDGSWDRNSVVELESVVNAADTPGITLIQNIPGRLALTCANISVQRGPERSFRPPAIPSPAEMLIWGGREVTWSDLLSWLRAPRSVRVFERNNSTGETFPVLQLSDPIKAPYFGVYRLQQSIDDTAPWVSVHWMLAITKVGHYFQLLRGTADDQAWAEVRRLPEKIGECKVLSGTVKTSGREWIRRWASESD